MSETPVQILGANGLPLRKPNKARALVGQDNTPYDAADLYGAHMAEWQPFLWSVDGENNIYRDRIVSRLRDMVRNDGWASGGVTRILDNAVGANFRPLAKPDYRAIQAYTGNAAFDDVWADEFGRMVEANYRQWAHDPGRYCDSQRSLTAPQMFRLGFRHKLVDGDGLGMLHWLPERVGVGRARYATAFQVIDPDRLSNPQLNFDTQTSRGGVKVDDFGVAVGYYIRRAHAGDWFNAADSVHWDLIPRETEWGRPIIVHDFERDRAGQHRGGGGVLTPVVSRLKMLVKYDSSELDAAILNAVFGAYIESPYDHQLVEQALDDEELKGYQAQRKEFHNSRKLSVGGVRMPTLFPGEKINTVTAARPAGNFEGFEKAVLRNVAAGLGISAQQLSQDWSDVNYSSARAALLEAWKTLSRRRHDFAVGYSQPIYTAWLEESFEVDEYPMPSGAAVEFAELRAAFSRAVWVGPGRGWIDPVAEREGSILGMDAGLSTLEQESIEQGLDWEETLDQRAREIRAFQARDIPVPTWSGILGERAKETIKKPEAQ
jgi:lambda family phage portal protein